MSNAMSIKGKGLIFSSHVWLVQSTVSFTLPPPTHTTLPRSHPMGSPPHLVSIVINLAANNERSWRVYARKQKKNESSEAFDNNLVDGLKWKVTGSKMSTTSDDSLFAAHKLHRNVISFTETRCDILSLQVSARGEGAVRGHSCFNGIDIISRIAN